MTPDEILEQIQRDTAAIRQAVTLLTFAVVGLIALGVILAIATAA